MTWTRPRTCGCLRNFHEHGCARRYYSHRCRCDLCRAAATAARSRDLRRQKAEGRFDRAAHNRSNQRWKVQAQPRRKTEPIRRKHRRYEPDWVVVQRLTLGIRVKARPCEKRLAIEQLRRWRYSEAQIAERIGVTTRTVCYHIARLREQEQDREEMVA